jgi:hypothetical protein
MSRAWRLPSLLVQPDLNLPDWAVLPVERDVHITNQKRVGDVRLAFLAVQVEHKPAQTAKPIRMNRFTSGCGTLSGSGRQDDGYVNQFRNAARDAEKPAQKRMWNLFRLGVPTGAVRNRETDRDASY